MASRRASGAKTRDASVEVGRSPEKQGVLYVVATPIGNLEDITLRALRILKEVAIVAAEDTRRTGNLLRHYAITTPLLSLHEHNERQRIPAIVQRLAQGQSIALVTDAGTPAISDPGAELVRNIRDAGFRVVPIPGPSSVVAALSAAGMASEHFVFGGFPPSRSKDRKKWWAWVGSTVDAAVVFFEAPHRVKTTLHEGHSVLGNRPIIAARELTKVHEEFQRGTFLELLALFSDPVGEFVFVIPPADPDEKDRPIPSDAEIADEFGRIAKNNRGGRREAVRLTAQALSLTPNVIYAALERARKLVD